MAENKSPREEKAHHRARAGIALVLAFMWRWDVVVVIAIAICITGAVSAFYADDFAGARWLFAAAIVLLTVKTLSWSEVTTHKDRIWASLFIVLLALGSLYGSMKLIQGREDSQEHAHDVTNQPAPATQSPAPGPSPATASKPSNFAFSILPPDRADKTFPAAEHPGIRAVFTADNTLDHPVFEAQCYTPCVFSRGFSVNTPFATGKVTSWNNSTSVRIPLDKPEKLESGQQVVLFFRSKDDHAIPALLVQSATIKKVTMGGAQQLTKEGPPGCTVTIDSFDATDTTEAVHTEGNVKVCIDKLTTRGGEKGVNSQEKPQPKPQ